MEEQALADEFTTMLISKYRYLSRNDCWLKEHIYASGSRSAGGRAINYRLHDTTRLHGARRVALVSRLLAMN